MPTTKERTQKPVETQPTAPAAAPVNDGSSPCLDPSGVLARRKKVKQDAAWTAARKLLLQSDLTEADVLRLADELEGAGLSPEWIGPFRCALEQHKIAHIAGSRVDELARQRAAANAALAEADATLKRETTRLEAELAQARGALHGCIIAQGSAIDAARTAENIGQWFRPLFDSDSGVDGFALPAHVNGLPPALYTAMSQAGLLDDAGGVTALTAPPRRPQPAPPPMLHVIGTGPGLVLEKGGDR
jgi:hypothetical protein